VTRRLNNVAPCRRAPKRSGLAARGTAGRTQVLRDLASYAAAPLLCSRACRMSCGRGSIAMSKVRCCGGTPRSTLPSRRTPRRDQASQKGSTCAWGLRSTPWPRWSGNTSIWCSSTPTSRTTRRTSLGRCASRARAVPSSSTMSCGTVASSMRRPRTRAFKAAQDVRVDRAGAALGGHGDPDRRQQGPRRLRPCPRSGPVERRYLAMANPVIRRAEKSRKGGNRAGDAGARDGGSMPFVFYRFVRID